MFIYKLLQILVAPFIFFTPVVGMLFLSFAVQLQDGSFQFFMLSTFIASAALTFFANKQLNEFIENRAWEFEKAKRVCKHGLAGGESLHRCGVCEEEKRRLDDERARVQQLEEEQKTKIQRRISLAEKAQEFNNARVHLYTAFERAQRQQVTYLRDLTPNDFEDKVADMFQHLGWSVTQTPYVNDQGKDIILKRCESTYFVECKKYADTTAVGRPDMNKLFGVMAAEKADGGYFVTTGRFTAEAVRFALNNGIEMVGPERLTLMMREAFPDFGALKPVEVMCSECNDIVLFDQLQDFDFSDVKTCRSGHKVGNAVFMEGKRLAFSKTLPTNKPKSSRRRSRRY